MNLFQIAWRNVLHRRVASFLTMLSMALGVALVVLVLCISNVLQQFFERSSNVGYNLIIGPKGGELQLVLNSVFYLYKPIGKNLSYKYYLEYLPQEKRQKEWELAGGEFAEVDRDGVYSLYTGGGFVIPICLGDYYNEFRVVATTPDFFRLLRFGKDQAYSFSQGRNFEDVTAEHSFFEAVVGAHVARTYQLKIGDTVNPSHGDGGGSHSQGFTVVGILNPTGTPNDRAVFINLEGFYLLENHQAVQRDEDTGLEIPRDPGHPTETKKQADSESPRRLPIDKREITAILYKSQNFGGIIGLENQINKSVQAQAVSPVRQILYLLETFLAPAQWSLLALTLCVCVASAVSILVSIYNSMSERSRDIAVMRALGASRNRVLMIILSEAILISVGGGILGWVIGHGIAALASPIVEMRAGVRVGFFDVDLGLEPYIIPGLVLIGIVAGLLPALVAYRTDVSKSL